MVEVHGEDRVARRRARRGRRTRWPASRSAAARSRGRRRTAAWRARSRGSRPRRARRSRRSSAGPDSPRRTCWWRTEPSASSTASETKFSERDQLDAVGLAARLAAQRRRRWPDRPRRAALRPSRVRRVDLFARGARGGRPRRASRARCATIFQAVSGSVRSPDSANTLASLCWRASAALSTSCTSAARTRGKRFAVYDDAEAAAADHDAARRLAARDRPRRGRRELGVVHRVGRVRADVPHLVAGGLAAGAAALAFRAKPR